MQNFIEPKLSDPQIRILWFALFNDVKAQQLNELSSWHPFTKIIFLLPLFAGTLWLSGFAISWFAQYEN